MPEERPDTNDTPQEGDAKPTITIAEKQRAAAAAEEGKPTITIAEKDSGDDE